MSESIVSILEFFPAELFAETFIYLDGYHIYLAFYGLNNRLSTMTTSYISKCIDLRKVQPDRYREIFSVIDRSRLKALKLSNACSDEQIEKLFNNNLHDLRSLTLDSVGAMKIDSIIRRHDISSCLESLSIWLDAHEYCEKVSATSVWIFQTCLSCSKSLKYLSIRKHKDRDSYSDRTALNSLMYSSVSKNFSWQHLHLSTVCINGLELVSSCLPNLQTLTTIVHLDSSNSNHSMMLCLHRCKLRLIRSHFQSIADFLSRCPNLEKLKLELLPAGIDTLNDQQWQTVIERHLPQLKGFEMNLRTNSVALDVTERLCTTSFQNNPFWQERKTSVIVLKREAFSFVAQTERIHIIICFSIG